MDTALQFLNHTPAWVYVLFAYLLYRGVRAFKPGAVSLPSLAVIPVLFTGLGLFSLLRQYGVHVPTLGLWLLALLVGTGIGTLLVRGSALRVDRARRVIHRPADYTVLPLMMLTFAAKYAFGAILATAPEVAAQPWFRPVEVITYGAFAGIFVGKFVCYVRAYRAAPPVGADAALPAA